MTEFQREIVVPHSESAPVTGVRNLLIQASLGALKANGYYERYTSHMDRAKLEQLLEYVAPSWVPVELALAHYAACEKLCLTSTELTMMGRSTGDRLQSTTLVSAAKKSRDRSVDIWSL